MTALADQLSKLLTTPQVAAMFCRTELTILNWRKSLGFPAIVIPGKVHPSVRYDYDAVRAWATAHGKVCYDIKGTGIDTAKVRKLPPKARTRRPVAVAGTH